MNKKISLGAAIAFMLVVAGIVFTITMWVSFELYNEKVANVKEREQMYEQLADIDQKSRQYYAGVIDEKYLLDSISKGFIKGIGDKYSSYLTKTEYEEKLLEISGRRFGIGISYTKETSGYFMITSVAKDSPAEKAGILQGDIIISIDGIDLKSVTQANAEKLMKGEVGSKVQIVYRRDGADTTKEMQRKDIEVSFVSSRMIEENGYFKIKEFNEKTAMDFKVQLDSIMKNHPTGLIIDLRNNNSDSFSTANDILDMILPKGDLGIEVGKDGQKKVTAISDEYSIDLPIAILVNSKTGNAAEYFASTIIDFNKGSTIGVKTMGKCVKQELIPLTDGSAINITVAYMLSSSGTEINTIGLNPQYNVKLDPEQEAAFNTLTEKNDPQLIKAIEVVNANKK